MLQLFKNNDFLTNILVVVYFIFFAVGAWVYPISNLNSFESNPATLLYFLQSLLNGEVFNKVAFSLLVLLQAFYLNYLVNEYKVARQQSTIPAICFILLHFAHPLIDTCNPVIIANTFLLFSLHCLLASYDKKVSLGAIFNIGFWIGVAALFYNSHFIYIIWAMIGLIIVRTFDLQEFLIMLVGFATPLFLAATAWFAFDDLGWWWQDVMTMHLASSQIMFEVDNSFWLLLSILGLPYILSIINIGSLQFKTTSKEKKYINAILIMPIIGLFTFLFQHEIYAYHFLSFVIPIGLLFGLLAQALKNALAAEVIHLLLFMACLGLQYQSFFFG